VGSNCYGNLKVDSSGCGDLKVGSSVVMNQSREKEPRILRASELSNGKRKKRKYREREEKKKGENE
jgi:hypothetical protein